MACTGIGKQSAEAETKAYREDEEEIGDEASVSQEDQTPSPWPMDPPSPAIYFV